MPSYVYSSSLSSTIPSWTRGLHVEGGLVMYRGVECYCHPSSPTSDSSGTDGTVSSTLTPTSHSTSPATTTSPSSLEKQTQTPYSSLDSPYSHPDAISKIEIFTDEEVAAHQAAQQSLAPEEQTSGRVALGKHTSQCRLVLVKTHTNLHPTSDEVARLQYCAILHEKIYTASGKKGYVAPHLRYLTDKRFALIMHDNGGITLREIMQQEFMKNTFEHRPSKHIHQPITIQSIRTTLSIILDIANRLSLFHQQSLVHKNLHPSGILLNRSTHECFLVGLTTSSILGREKVEPDMNLHSLSISAWSYLAPEASGKANRIIDARSDLYSLGVIMYELIVGHPPFQSNDILELVHMHLAKAPPPIIPKQMTSISHPHIFPAISVTSAIIMKLLQKQAEDRYQSTSGLIHDLQGVLTIIDEIPPPIPSTSPSPLQSPSVSPSRPPTRTLSISTSTSVSSNVIASPAINKLQQFQIGSWDANSTFRISQRLYGREAEVEALIRAYHQVSGLPPPKTPSSLRRVLESEDSTTLTSTIESTHTPMSSKSSHSASSSISGTAPSSSSPSHLQTNAVVASTPQLVLVSGYSGIGKTSLVDELHKHIVRQRGLFARSKFDQLKRDSSCLLQAFRHLMIQLLVHDSMQWKLKILKAVGTNGQVICDVIPELTRLIGEQPPVPKLSTSEAANRFNMVFCQFVSCLSSPTSPLTLFIDDLQWSDVGSLSLLQLLAQQESNHLLIIGAYRSNEVDSSHPLTRFKQEIQESADERMTEIVLKPLEIEHINELLMDSFRRSYEDSLPLAQLLANKTSGNPFFINTMLRSFYDSKLLYFNFDTGRWEWNLDQIRLTSVQEDVVDVLCKQMQNLSRESQNFLQYAACSGTIFNLHTLLLITQLSLAETVRAAREVEQTGMVLCLSNQYDLVLLSEHTSTSTTDASIPRGEEVTESKLIGKLQSISFRFSHDRIQAAAYRLIPPEALTRVHFTITRQLLSAFSSDQLYEYAVDITQHLIVGYHELFMSQPASASTTSGATLENREMWESFMSQNGILEKVILLELTAAMQAKAASSYENAIKFLIAALQLVQHKPTILSQHRASQLQSDSPILIPSVVSSSPPSPKSANEFFAVDGDCWRHSYDIVFRIYQEYSQCLFLSSNFDGTERMIRYVFQHIPLLLDRAIFFELHLMTLNRLLRMQDSLDAGLRYLKELGIELLPAMTEELRSWLFDHIDPNDETTYKNHPVFLCQEVSDPLLMAIIGAVAPAVFFLHSPLFQNISMTMLQLTMIHGVTPDTAFAMAIYAMSIWHNFDDLPKNYGQTSEKKRADGHRRPLSHHLSYRSVFVIVALGRIGLTLLDRYSDAGRPAAGRTHAAQAVIFPWRDSLHSHYQFIIRSWEDGLQISDFEWLSYIGMHVIELPFICNHPLPTILQKGRAFVDLLVKKRLLLTSQYAQTWLELYEDLSCVEHKSVHINQDNSIAILQLGQFVARGIGHYFARRIGSALDDLERGIQPLAAVPGIASTAIHCFYYCLALCESCPRLPIVDMNIDTVKREQASEEHTQLVSQRMAQAQAMIDKMKRWSERAPHNYEHKLLLMQAEYNRVRIFSLASPRFELILPTMQLYEQAISGGRLHHFPIEVAVACELLSRFYYDCHRMELGAYYIREAYSYYADCNLTLKLDQLPALYPSTEFGSQTIIRSTMSTPFIQSPSGARGIDTRPISGSSSVPIRMRGLSINGHGNGSSSHVLPTPPKAARTSPLSQQSGNISSSNTPTPAAISAPATSKHDPLPPSPCPTNSAMATKSLPILLGTDCANAVPVHIQPPSMVSPPSASSFDAVSILKATSTYSTEKNPTKLLKRLMRIVLETASATRGGLVLQDSNGDWCVELSASVDHDEKSDTHPTQVPRIDEVKSAEIEENDMIMNGLPTFHQSLGQPIGQADEQVIPAHQSWNDSISTNHENELTVSLTDIPTSFSSDLHSHLLSDLAAEPNGPVSFGSMYQPAESVSPISSGMNSPLWTEVDSLNGGHIFHHHPRIRLGPSKTKELSEILPMSIFQYVVTSAETVLLSDPYSAASTEAAAFLSDPYFESHTPKALLCMPVFKAGKVFGVLYLENDYHLEAFNSSHIQLLQLLCGQAALSIDNARLYTELSQHNVKLEQTVQERTSELHEKNRQLQLAKEEAERATKIKAEFLSNMSHEIRTPMNAVLGIGRLLSETELSVEQQQYVTMINNSGHLLLTIINDILDYSKIEAGQLKLNFHPHNIVDVVETAVMLCYDMATTKGLQLWWSIDPSLPGSLMVDSTRLQQILLNLLSNAIKFTKQGEVVLTVTGQLVSPPSLSPPVEDIKEASATIPFCSSSTTLTASSSMPFYDLAFSVRDSGIGISPTQLATLFRSFSQVQHISGEYGGTGLGLVISKRLVEAMGGGEIHVQSELGHGSTFSFHIRADFPIPQTEPLPSTVLVPSGPNRRMSVPALLSTQLHGLSTDELQLLNKSRLIYIGELNAVAKNLILLLQYYTKRIQSFTSMEVAMVDLFPSNIPSFPLDFSDTAVLVDLDSVVDNDEEVTREESFRSLFSGRAQPLRALFLYSKAHGAPSEQPLTLSTHTTPQSLKSSPRATQPFPIGSPISSPSVRAIVSDAQSSPLSNSLLTRSTSMRLRSLHHAQVGSPDSPPKKSINNERSTWDERFTAAGRVTPTKLSVPSSLNTTELKPFEPVLPFSLDSTRPPFGMDQSSSIGSSQFASLSSTTALGGPFSLPSPTSAMSLNPSPISSTATSPSFRRLRRPFKIRALLAAIVSLLEDTASSPMESPVSTAPPTPLTTSQLLGVSPINAAPSPASTNSAKSQPDISDATRSRMLGNAPMANGPASKSKIVNIAQDCPLRILLAEDNVINQKMMVMMLRKLGYEILIASNGEEVLTILDSQASEGRSAEIECILMDASMDVMDGIECTRIIRAKQSSTRIRPFIVAQTANVTDEYRQKCLEAGMDMFISKPIHLEDLVKCLRAAYHFHHRQQADSSIQPRH